MFRSGFMIRMPVRISAIKLRRPVSGVIMIMIIRKPVIMQYTEVVLWDLIMYLWMVRPVWKMI